MYLWNSAEAFLFVFAPWHLSSSHHITLWHAALLTRAAVMSGANVPRPLHITALFIKRMTAENMLQDSCKWVAVEIGGCECWWEGRVTLKWRLIGPHGGDVIIRKFVWIITNGSSSFLDSKRCHTHHETEEEKMATVFYA